MRRGIFDIFPALGLHVVDGELRRILVLDAVRGATGRVSEAG